MLFQSFENLYKHTIVIIVIYLTPEASYIFMLCVLYSIILLGLRSQTHEAVKFFFIFLFVIRLMTAIYFDRNM